MRVDGLDQSVDAGMQAGTERLGRNVGDQLPLPHHLTRLYAGLRGRPDVLAQRQDNPRRWIHGFYERGFTVVGRNIQLGD